MPSFFFLKIEFSFKSIILKIKILREFERGMYIAFIYLRTKKIPKPLVARIILLTDVQKYFDHACINDMLWMMKFTHENGANIKANYDKPIWYACYYGHLEVVKYLHKNGAVIGACDDSAFYWACVNGRIQIVKYLHQNGVDLRADGDAPIRWARDNGHSEIVEYLSQFIAN